MHGLVYLPLVVPVLAAGSARWLSERLEPRLATWLFTVSAVLLALTTVTALAALAATAIGQFRPVATVGNWSVRALRRDDPTSLTVALAATVLVTAAGFALARIGWRRARALFDAARTVRHLPGTGDFALLDDPVPAAYALPGLPGRIVVSTGMLRALRPRERTALVAHERAHLAGRHHLFVALTHIAAAANPLLRPLDLAVRYTVERWADERAAAVVSDRPTVARAIGTAALLARDRTRPPPRIALAMARPTATWMRTRAAILLGGTDVAAPGPVPRRVAALLTDPPRRRVGLLILVVVALAVASVSTVQTCRDLDTLFDLARAARSHP